MVTLANLINKVDLILNYILTISYIIVSSCISVLSLLNTKNWPYPIVNYLNTPILIILPIKLSVI